MGMRTEKDTLGEIDVPEERLYGAQTRRSQCNFPIGTEEMPLEVIHAFGFVKKASALVNHDLGLLDETKKEMIVEAADALIAGSLDDEFPLSVWQTGSGTQSNMNVNEVLSNYCIRKVGGVLGSKDPIHPNDHVNMSQSSNDTFPTAMHIAALRCLNDRLLPNLSYLHLALREKAEAFDPIVKTGRTHLMDATPLTLGQEFSGYAQQIEHGIRALEHTLAHLREIPLGGTAVGTGLNTHPRYANKVAHRLSELLGFEVRSATNKFEGLAASDAMVELSGALKRVAVSFHKIANDIRLLGSGPRCGLGELQLPENEPGSSIMPGKVNPTQCESVTMVCAQVFGNDVAVNFGGANGHLELNVYRPLIVYNVLQSIRLLADSARNFVDRCVTGIVPNESRIQHFLTQSLMLATALNKVIGYDKAAALVKKAHAEGKTLKEVVVASGTLTEAEFDTHINPANMVRPQED